MMRNPIMAKTKPHVPRDKRGRVAKGAILNPTGRPPCSVSLTTALKRRLLEDPAEVDALVESLLKLFHAGHPTAIAEVFKRVDGLVTQQIDLQRVTVVELPMHEMFDELAPTKDWVDP